MSSVTIGQLTELLSSGSWKGFPEARGYLRTSRTRAEIRALAEVICRSEIRSREDYGRRRIRIGIVGAYSTENLRDALAVQCLDRGLFCEQYHAPFAQFGQEIRNSQSGLYCFQPDVVVLVPQRSNYATMTEDAARELAQEVADDVAIVQRHFSGPVLVQNFLPPESRPAGVLDFRKELGVADFFRLANYCISRKLASVPGVIVLDAAHLAKFASLSWTWLHKPNYLAGCALPDQLAMPLARDMAAVGAALKGFAHKCLVMDLDNTLWGGVVGEEGVAGVQIGGSFPGNVYAALQREILSLFERGVILAINSRNNEEDAWCVFRERPEMILRRQHFSCAKINWQDKVGNLNAISEELNIGLDSMVVLDDDPVQRGSIEACCPEVYVLPAGDPLEMLRCLSTLLLFDALSISHEDALRAKSYAASQARKHLQHEKADLVEFLHSLEMVVAVAMPTAAHMGRFAQLTQKTNQFNLNARRYSESEIRAMALDTGRQLFCCSCRDRFADEGIVGAAIVRKEQKQWVLEAFLLSCRALGRGLEQAFLSAICRDAEQAGADSVVTQFVPSEKNRPVEPFLRNSGFNTLAQHNGSSTWRLALPAAARLWPDWVKNANTNPVCAAGGAQGC